jgi:ligand-binding SRPBCC domain-containing protein
VIESADLPIREGSVIKIAVRDPLGRRLRWESRIAVFSPPHPVVFGMEARFVDVQMAGPFAMWTHEHEFEAVDDKRTRVLDRVTYKPPMGFMGFIADWLYVRWKIRRMLAFREKALRAALER